MLAYLARRPYENVYMQWIVESGYVSYHDDSLVFWRNAAGEIGGAAYYGPQYVLTADDERALDAFAIEARRHAPARMFVGSKPSVDGLWSRVRGWHRAPSLVRAAQPLYAATTASLIAAPDARDVRTARLDDLDLVIANSAEMILGELGYDPRLNRIGFASGVRSLIDRGWWWVWIVDGTLRFMCNVGSRTEATAQIQGVWTPPALRGRGYATRGMAAIAQRLLERNASLSLYVNDFNDRAIALYERLGFERVGEFATYVFGV